MQDTTRAEREASDALARVKRDYTSGALSAEDWAELRPELTEERDGARAELERLHAQTVDIESWSVSAMRKRRCCPGSLTSAARSQARSRTRTGSIRSGQRCYACLSASSSTWTCRRTDGRIESVVRRKVIETVEGEAMTPVLRPTALEIAGENQSVGCATTQAATKTPTFQMPVIAMTM